MTSRLRLAVLAGLITTLLALVPRWGISDGYATADESAFWFPRSQKFRTALESGRPAQTCIAPHPGVTTMWSGAIGHWIWASDHAEVPRKGLAAREYRVLGRRGVGLGSAVAIGVAVGLLVAFVGPAVGVGAGALLIGDTFFTAHSRILHNDALVASFFLLATLAGWRAGEARGRARVGWWVFGALAVALSSLSKLTGAVGLLPLFGPSLWSAWSEAPGTPRERAGAALREGARALAWITPVGVGATLLLWPAAWADPLCVVGLFGRAVDLGGAAHENGNFFAGAPVEDPGWAFYLVAVSFRLGAVTWLGLIPGVWVAVRGDRLARVVGLTALFVLVLLTLEAKKFDRYALPVLPLLDVLAALGWWGLLGAIGWTDVRRRVLAGILAAGLLFAGIAPAVRARGVELVTYNPLLGGADVAREWLLFGWGEGLEGAGRWLRQRASCDDVVIAPYIPVMLPFTCQTLRRPERVAQGAWIVVYANQLQREQLDGLEPWVVGKRPVHTVRIDGQEIAWVYRGPVKPARRR